MIHQADMIVGIGVPRPVGLERACGLASLGVAQIRRDDAVFVLELVERVERVGRARPATVELSPPPGITSNGKPEPASS